MVHDWLHNYCYREAIIYTRGNKTIAAMSTFLISAVFHEYIITLALGFYYPVLFFLFAVIGMAVYFISIYFRRHEQLYGNVFLFCSIFFGWSIQVVLYAAEWYSRANCPQTRAWIVDKSLPRSWSC